MVKTGRMMLGATNPLDSAPGTIRGDFCIDVGRNIIHGSDAVESAEHEIKLWFPEGKNAFLRSFITFHRRRYLHQDHQCSNLRVNTCRKT